MILVNSPLQLLVSPRAHPGIARPPGGRERTGGTVVWHEDGHDRAGLDLPDKRVRREAPRIFGPDHRVDWHTEPLLGAAGGAVDILAARPADNQDI